jgi:hypothetical protein
MTGILIITPKQPKRGREGQLLTLTAYLKEGPDRYVAVWRDVPEGVRSPARYLAELMLHQAKALTPEGRPLALAWLVKGQGGEKMVLARGEWVPLERGRKRGQRYTRWVYFWPLKEMVVELKRLGNRGAKRLAEELEKLLKEEGQA